MKTSLITSLLIGAAILPTVGCARLQNSAEGEGNATPKAVRMAVVELSKNPEPAKYSVIIAPNAQVDLAFRVSGYVVALYQTKGADGRIRPLDSGAPVAAGTTLARIRASEFQATVDKARGVRNEADAGIHAAEAQIAEAQAGLLQIPLDALVHDPTGDRYLVYTTEQKAGRTFAKAIPIRPGPLSGSQVSILDGLTPGQRIVVSGANMLRPGEAVREVN